MIIHGGALTELKKLSNDSIDCCITSPPYWGLRDYGIEGQLGLEPRFQDYIENLCQIFDEVKRVLKPQGTCWVNIGDSYAGNSGGSYGDRSTLVGKQALPQKLKQNKESGLPSKCLVQIPSRFAIAMTDRGWILRNEIIWHKPNCMPQSVKDRFTIDFEKVYFFTKSKRYYFEQQYEPQKDWGLRDRTNGKYKSAGLANGLSGILNPNGRNKRAVWSIPTTPYNEAHFATFPEVLVRPVLKAGCPEGGIVLDPFFGSGTVGKVAKKSGRRYIGIELNPEYIRLAEKRLRQEVLL